MRWRHLHAPVGPRELPATCQSGRPHPSPPPRGASIAGPPPPLHSLPPPALKGDFMLPSPLSSLRHSSSTIESNVSLSLPLASCPLPVGGRPPPGLDSPKCRHHPPLTVCTIACLPSSQMGPHLTPSPVRSWRSTSWFTNSHRSPLVIQNATAGAHLHHLIVASPNGEPPPSKHLPSATPEASSFSSEEPHR
jgi:hypothetical protein